MICCIFHTTALKKTCISHVEQLIFYYYLILKDIFKRWSRDKKIKPLNRVGKKQRIVSDAGEKTRKICFFKSEPLY